MKKKGKKRNKKIKKFDYQKFMVEYNLTKEMLDKRLVKMINILEDYVAEQLKKGVANYSLENTSQVQLFADFIMDEVWDHVQEHGLPEEESKEEIVDVDEPNPLQEQIDFLEDNYSEGFRKVESDVLAEIGVEQELLNKRLFEIGHFIFSRQLMSSTWNVYKGTSKNTDQEDNKEEK